MTTGKYPRRAHELICTIGADSKEGIVHELEEFARRIARDDISHGCIGGSDCGAIYSYRHDPAMTHDAYFEQLNAQLEKEHATSSPAVPQPATTPAPSVTMLPTERTDGAGGDS